MSLTPTPSFLGNAIEICIVTPDYKATLNGLLALGIGPWRVYTFSPANTTEQTYRGRPAAFSLKVCFAELGRGMTYEVISPLSGPTIFADWLAAHNNVPGIHHIAYDMHNLPWEQRIKAFTDRGFSVSQYGNFGPGNRFAFFETEGSTGTCFETYEFGEGWVQPEPEEWVPAREGGVEV